MVIKQIDSFHIDHLISNSKVGKYCISFKEKKKKKIQKKEKTQKAIWCKKCFEWNQKLKYKIKHIAYVPLVKPAFVCVKAIDATEEAVV